MNQILSDEEVNELWNDSFIGADPTSGNQRFKFTKLVEATILAKLASAELPEPLGGDFLVEGLNYYTAEHLRQAHAQGAAAQLSAEPFGIWHQAVDPDECDFYLFEDSGDVACKDCKKLYTRKEAK